MSSFNVHKIKVLDSMEPLAHRCSHARSCVNKVANLTGKCRTILIQDIQLNTGVDLDSKADEASLLKAFNYLLEVRAIALQDKT